MPAGAAPKEPPCPVLPEAYAQRRLEEIVAEVGHTVVRIDNGVDARWELRQVPTSDEGVATPCREALGSSLIVPPAAW